MATHKSAIKRIRQNEKRRIHNRTFRNRARTLVKKARVSMQGDDLDAAREATRAAARDLDMLASRGGAGTKKRKAGRRRASGRQPSVGKGR